ncbi:hypothetical protein QJS04_geneDACA023544 [Acorus gramineus]|uniref:MULE transposase domain-containing protein n=1 Tax=Acorus gramineus TaxID=55184 RepID=A0AAV9A2Z2_ACOGR|nr:hypothetical protein QJS04_geneDACA023544 [Acorus gramineus]
MQPPDILTHLKSRDPTNVSSIKNIYNARAKLRVHETCGRTHMQQLMKLIYEHGYIERHQAQEEAEIVSEIFFAHPTSVELVKAFPIVFMIDCTYKTSRYRMPLLEIVGVTSTGKTFAAAFVYLSAEKEENYTWAMGCFNSMFDGATPPKVIITDHELGLMKAISVVFPSIVNLLCRVHITKNVVKNCRKEFSDVETWDAFMGSWAEVMKSFTEVDFYRKLQLLEDEYRSYPNVLSYLHATWLDKHRERFVTAWIDRQMHLGNTSTNRVESHHSKLKRALQTSTHNFVSSLQMIHNLLELQISDIRASFEESLTKIPHRFQGYLFRHLVGVVSVYALQKLQMKICASDGVDQCESICGHALNSSCGLPCAHMIAGYRRDGGTIPISEIHPFWQKLGITPLIEDFADEVDISPEIDMLFKSFTDGNIIQQKEINKVLKKLSDPTATLLLEPVVKVNTKGRKRSRKKRDKALAEESTKRSPSCFEYVLQSVQRLNSVYQVIPMQALEASNPKQCKRPKMVVQRGRVLHNRAIEGEKYMAELPPFLSPFISSIYDVIGDGHCGFRVVASFLGMANEGWRDVRNNLFFEIEQHLDMYMRVLLLYMCHFYPSGHHWSILAVF